MSISMPHIVCLWTEERKDKDRASHIKLKDGECNTCKKAGKSIMNSPSPQTCLDVLFSLIFSVSFGLRCVYSLYKRKQTETP